MNQWNGIVRLVADVNLRYTPSGTAVATWTGAVDKFNAKKLKDEGKPSANFIRFKCFGKRAETISQYFSKGDQIGITGAIDTGSYEKENVKIFTTDILVSDFAFVGNRGEKKTNEASSFSADDDFSFSSNGSFEDFQQIEDDDDIPF